MTTLPIEQVHMSRRITYIPGLVYMDASTKWLLYPSGGKEAAFHALAYFVYLIVWPIASIGYLAVILFV